MDPEYVLDRMESYEITTILKNLHLKNKDGWEQTRLVSYMVAQVNSTKELKVKDIMTFPWEKEVEEESSLEDRQAVLDEMKQIENKLNRK